MNDFINLFFTQLANGFNFFINFQIYNGITLFHLMIFIALILLALYILNNKD
jgi:hypothetical protein